MSRRRRRHPHSILNAVAPTFFSRVATAGGALSPEDVAAANVVATCCLVNGLTDANCRLNLFVGNSLTAALVPLLRGGGPDVDSSVNFVAGDYTRATGITGNGSSKYLNTGVGQNSFAAQDRHLAAYLMRRETPFVTDAFIGSEDGVGGINSFALKSESGGQWSKYLSSSTSIGPEFSNTATGLILGTNTGANTSSVYVNGSLANSTSVTVATPVPEPIFVFAMNRNNASVVDYVAVPIGGYSVGPGLTAAQALSFSTAWQQAMTILGRAV